MSIGVGLHTCIAIGVFLMLKRRSWTASYVRFVQNGVFLTLLLFLIIDLNGNHNSGDIL
jgi:hypothetical protein